jgi:hypothetical protein
MASNSLANIRHARKLNREKNNAAQTAEHVPAPVRGAWVLPAALAFVFLLLSLVGLGIGTPASAVDLNLSWVVSMFESIFGAATDAMPTFERFIDTGFPLLIKIGIYGAILGMIGLFVWFFRELIIRVLKMIGIVGGS